MEAEPFGERADRPFWLIPRPRRRQRAHGGCELGDSKGTFAKVVSLPAVLLEDPLEVVSPRNDVRLVREPSGNILDCRCVQSESARSSGCESEGFLLENGEQCKTVDRLEGKRCDVLPIGPVIKPEVNQHQRRATKLFLSDLIRMKDREVDPSESANLLLPRTKLVRLIVNV